MFLRLLEKNCALSLLYYLSNAYRTETYNFVQNEEIDLQLQTTQTITYLGIIILIIVGVTFIICSIIAISYFYFKKSQKEYSENVKDSELERLLEHKYVNEPKNDFMEPIMKGHIEDLKDFEGINETKRNDTPVPIVPLKGPSGLINEKETCYMNSMIQTMSSSQELINEFSNVIEKVENEKKKLIEKAKEDDTPIPIVPLKGPSGLINDKETCYMNSMIQAMASSQELINECINVIEKVENENSQKMTLLLDVLQAVNDPYNTAQTNTDKLKKLMNSTQWNRTSQEDTFQLLSVIINSIQKDMKDDLVKKIITMPPKFMLLHTFSESSGYNKVQDHLALALPLCGDFRNEPGEVLNTLMDEFFRPSIIDDGPFNTQISLFQKAPDVLILHIQANEWNDVKGAYIKPKYYIRYKDKMEYEFNIHMEKDGSKMEKVKVVYNLTAVVHHMGIISGGHYVAYRIHEGVWYLTNDEQVEEMSFKYDKVPYGMVYEKDKACLQNL